jgi:hypothetical protein
MPFGDGTGPMGMGPMTGRAAGYCAGYGVPGYMNPGFGRGYGRGFYGRGRGGGRGRGRGNRYWAFGFPGQGYGAGPVAYGQVPVALSTEQELAGLKQQSEYMQSTLEEINERIKELEKAKQEE